MKNSLKNWVIICLAIITLVSLFLAVSALRQKYDFLITIQQMKFQLSFLEKEKQNLLQELEKEKKSEQMLVQKNKQLKNNLKASQKRMDKLFADFALAQNKLEELGGRFSILRSENRALGEQATQAVKSDVEQKAKKESLAELKKLIRDLRRQIFNVRFEIKEKTQDKDLSEGNRGFMLREGKDTSSGNVKIEVIPAPNK